MQPTYLAGDLIPDSSCSTDWHSGDAQDDYSSSVGVADGAGTEFDHAADYDASQPQVRAEHNDCADAQPGTHDKGVPETYTHGSAYELPLLTVMLPATETLMAAVILTAVMAVAMMEIAIMTAATVEVPTRWWLRRWWVRRRLLKSHNTSRCRASYCHSPTFSAQRVSARLLCLCG